MNSRKLSFDEFVAKEKREYGLDLGDEAKMHRAWDAALAQQKTDVTKIAGWCALCEQPNGCPHGHSDEEWIEANHRMIEKRRAALAQQAQPNDTCEHCGSGLIVVHIDTKRECPLNLIAQQAQPPSVDEIEAVAKAWYEHRYIHLKWHEQGSTDEVRHVEFRRAARAAIEALDAFRNSP